MRQYIFKRSNNIIWIGCFIALGCNDKTSHKTTDPTAPQENICTIEGENFLCHGKAGQLSVYLALRKSIVESKRIDINTINRDAEFKCSESIGYVFADNKPWLLCKDNSLVTGGIEANEKNIVLTNLVLIGRNATDGFREFKLDRIEYRLN